MTLTTELVQSLQTTILDLLRPLVSKQRVALIDFPIHANCGDSAIYLGEMEALRRLHASVVFRCEESAYSPRLLRAAGDDVILLIHGGGNFGDLWLPHHRFRERVIRDFPDRTIVQLPQSIHFQQPENLRITQELIQNHWDFRLFTREMQSMERAERDFDCEVVLCPDMAFMLGAMERPVMPSQDIFVLARTDTEAVESLVPVAMQYGLATNDWLRDWKKRTSLRSFGTAERWDLLLASRLRLLGSTGFSPAAIDRLAELAYRRLSGREVATANQALSSGRVVLTDRLHAHILGELLGIPHVAVETGYGKIRGVHDAWLSRSPLAHLCSTPQEGFAKARELAS